MSCAAIAAIWVLCFCTTPHTPLDNVRFIDKWTHISMYFLTCTAIWFEMMRNHVGRMLSRLTLWAWAAPVAMSGIIELLQAYCTNGRRSGDWLDFAANAAGATMAALIGILVARCRAKG